MKFLSRGKGWVIALILGVTLGAALGLGTEGFAAAAVQRGAHRAVLALLACALFAAALRFADTRARVGDE